MFSKNCSHIFWVSWIYWVSTYSIWKHDQCEAGIPNIAANNELAPFVEVYVPVAEIDPLVLEIEIELIPIHSDEQAEAALNLALDDESIENKDVEQTASNNENGDDDDDDDEVFFSGEVSKP